MEKIAEVGSREAKAVLFIAWGLTLKMRIHHSNPIEIS